MDGQRGFVIHYFQLVFPRSLFRVRNSLLSIANYSKIIGSSIVSSKKTKKKNWFWISRWNCY